jgi:glycerol-3-phosphate dehydrogenase subunit C
MGFKKDFYLHSVKIASRLVTRIRSADPEMVVTDCLSCRMQFMQLLPYEVAHPVELIKKAYENAEKDVRVQATA